MKTTNSIILILLFIAIRLIHSNEGRKSLEVTRKLKNKTYVKRQKVNISCTVDGATNYSWYKDGNYIKSGKNMVIKQFSKEFVGTYKCKGRDSYGNSGRTKAKLDLVSPCKRPHASSKTTCFDALDQYSCRNRTTIAPSAENMKLEIEVAWGQPWLLIYVTVTWDVPTKEADRIWGWQIRIIDTSGQPHNNRSSLGEQRCYQVNVGKKKYAYTDASSIIKERHAFSVSYQTSYNVWVSSLPRSITAVKKSIKTPSFCDTTDNKACCESYVNTSLVVSDNGTMLNWTTYYPVSLNVGIEGFQITWFSGRDGGASNCDYKKVVLDSMQSNYTIQGLQSSGCRNYTIMLEVIFKSDTYPGCTESKPEILFFISPPDPDVTSITPPIHIAKSSSSGAMATAGFAVAAILGGIVIVGLMFLWMRRKKPKPSMEALGVENGQIQDYQITSSSFCEGLPPQEGRLHGDACWSASGNDKNQWIQIDLSRDKDITAIATQGRKDADEWVKSYIVSYSTDGKEFQCYQDDGVWKLFEGNTDKNTVQKNDLSSPITARFIRIHPQSWFDHISMRIELYGLNGSSQKGVKVLILNPHHCNLCTGVVHALGTLLIKTGHIRCAVDIFTPVRDMCNGLTSWTQDMILNSDYVIIPWLCKVNPPRQDNTVNDIKSLIFGASLKIVEAELVTQNRRNKFIPVCLDDYLLEDLPPNLMLLPTYNIPSEIDDLVINLLGKTKQRPDTKWPIVEFEDKDYRVARSNLQEAVNKRKKDHPHL